MTTPYVSILETTPTHPQGNSYVTIEEANAYFQNRAEGSDWALLTDQQKDALLLIATQQLDTLRIQNQPLFDYQNFYRMKQLLKFPTANQIYRPGVFASVGTKEFTGNALRGIPTLPSKLFNDGGLIVISGVGRGNTYKVKEFDATLGHVSLVQDWIVQPAEGDQFWITERVPLVVKFATCEQAIYIINGGRARQKMQAEGVKGYRIGDLQEQFADNVSASRTLPICADAKSYMKGLYSIIGILTA